jgi:hypothetical protein
MPIVESKEAAKYTNHGSPAEHCGICEHYRAGGTRAEGYCRIVTGKILEGGWCRHFIRKKEAA